MLLFPYLLAAQSPPPHSPTRTFEWANIRPSAPDSQGHRFQVNGDRLEITNTSLSDLISFVYGLHATQIVGAPDWVQTDKYDLTIHADAAAQPGEMLWRILLQKYLLQCFQLKFHRDTKSLPLYALTSLHPDPKLKRSPGDPGEFPQLSITLRSKNATSAAPAAISARNATIADLAGVLQRVVLEWPVVDRTGIAGKFDFVLTWTPDGAQFGDTRTHLPTPSGTANAAPNLDTALREQLGLSLDLLYEPLAVLVIDHVENPAEYPTHALRVQDGRFPGRILHPWRRPPPFTFSTEINPFLVTNNLY
jgi:uncharacterized protein (TIGR03435 family)